MGGEAHLLAMRVVGHRCSEWRDEARAHDVDLSDVFGSIKYDRLRQAIRSCVGAEAAIDIRKVWTGHEMYCEGLPMRGRNTLVQKGVHRGGQKCLCSGTWFWTRRWEKLCAFGRPGVEELFSRTWPGLRTRWAHGTWQTSGNG